jgi:hypothetical protein
MIWKLDILFKKSLALGAYGFKRCRDDPFVPLGCLPLMFVTEGVMVCSEERIFRGDGP